MKIGAIIIDDDIDSREILGSYLNDNCSEIALLGEAGSVKEAAALIKKLEPELLFLDIELPDGNGFDLLNSLPQRNFEVIFFTAYDKYAVQAFKMAAIDYLLKPVANAELDEAIRRISERKQKEQFNFHWQAFLHNSWQKNNITKKLAITTSDGFLFVALDEIIRLESHSNYTHFYFANKNKLVSSHTMGYYEDLLPPDKFCRIHNSHIINIDFIDRYTKEGVGGTVVLKDGMELGVSQRKKDDFLNYLGLGMKNRK